MSESGNENPSREPDWLAAIFAQLRDQGIELENLCQDAEAGAEMKVICVAADMRESFRELRKRPRGETVMVRVDEDVRQMLDAWVETGHFRSRSEAAALFLKEGLRIRASELEELAGAIRQVQNAKQSLQDKAKTILGSHESDQ